MAAATESPPKGGFQFNDDQEYPPLTQKADWETDIPLFLGNVFVTDEPQFRYHLIFGTVFLIHVIVRISEKIILYLFDLEEWFIVICLKWMFFKCKSFCSKLSRKDSVCFCMLCNFIMWQRRFRFFVKIFVLSIIG